MGQFDRSRLETKGRAAAGGGGENQTGGKTGVVDGTLGAGEDDGGTVSGKYVVVGGNWEGTGGMVGV